MNDTPNLTRAEFIAKCMAKSERETRKLMRIGASVPCDCDYIGCQGWRWDIKVLRRRIMGVSQSVYVGAYYKVWPGEEKYQSRTGLCPECARYFAATFCPDHGEALIFKAAVRKRDVIELIEERFEEEEYTRLGEGDGWDFDVVIRQDWDDKGAMGEFVETDGDDVLYDMPSLYDFGGDPLVAYLTEKDIRHETCYGIVVTWG